MATEAVSVAGSDHTGDCVYCKQGWVAGHEASARARLQLLHCTPETSELQPVGPAA